MVILNSFFSTYKIFPTRGWIIPVSTFKREYFNEKISSLVGLRKSYLIFRKNTDFGHFCLPGSTFKVNFLNVQAKFQIILGQFPVGSCQEHCVIFWAFYLQKGAGGASRFASRQFPKSEILASCNFVGRPFVAYYACSTDIFLFS